MCRLPGGCSKAIVRIREAGGCGEDIWRVWEAVWRIYGGCLGDLGRLSLGCGEAV